MILTAMHWRTFERLKAKHDVFANASCAGIVKRLRLMNRRLVGLGMFIDFFSCGLWNKRAFGH